MWCSVLVLALGSGAFFVSRRRQVPYAGRLILIFAISTVTLTLAGLVARGSWNPFLPNCAPTQVVLSPFRPSGLTFAYDDASTAQVRVRTDGRRVTGLSCVQSPQ